MHNLYILFNAHCTCTCDHRLFKSIHEYSLVTIGYTCHSRVKLHNIIYLICKNYGYKPLVCLAFLTSIECKVENLAQFIKKRSKTDSLFFHDLQKGKGAI